MDGGDSRGALRRLWVVSGSVARFADASGADGPVPCEMDGRDPRRVDTQRSGEPPRPDARATGTDARFDEPSRAGLPGRGLRSADPLPAGAGPGRSTRSRG